MFQPAYAAGTVKLDPILLACVEFAHHQISSELHELHSFCQPIRYFKLGVGALFSRKRSPVRHQNINNTAAVLDHVLINDQATATCDNKWQTLSSAFNGEPRRLVFKSLKCSCNLASVGVRDGL
jgi:hypothetical protein